MEEINVSNSSNNNEKEEIKKIIELVNELEVLRDSSSNYPDFSKKTIDLANEIIKVYDNPKPDDIIKDYEEYNGKIDDIIKKIIECHKFNFIQILDEVEKMKEMLEKSNSQYGYANTNLNSLTDSINNLTTNDITEWKFNSVFFNELTQNLTEAYNIFEVTQSCDTFLKNNKLLECLKLYKEKKGEHQKIDSYFRNTDISTNVGERFRDLERDIKEKMILNLENLLFFKGENYLNKKIESLISYFVKSYSQISIEKPQLIDQQNLIDQDNMIEQQFMIDPKQIFIPMTRFISIINAVTDYNLKDKSITRDSTLNDDEFDYINEETKLYSLSYIIKCVKTLNGVELLKTIMENFYNNLKKNLSELLIKTIDILIEKLTNVDLIKYKLEEESDKIKNLLMIQVPLILFLHSICKMNLLIKAINPLEKEKLFIVKSYESLIQLLLRSFHYNKNISKKLKVNFDKENNIENDFSQAENIKHKIYELNYLSIDYFPLLYKLFNQFLVECKNNYYFDFIGLNEISNKVTPQLFKNSFESYYEKKFFDISIFYQELEDYDPERDDLKLKFLCKFNDIIDKLKKQMDIVYDASYNEILKILNNLFTIFNKNLNKFTTDLLSKCTYCTLFDELYQMINPKKTNPVINESQIVNDILFDFQFRLKRKGISNINDNQDKDADANVKASDEIDKLEQEKVVNCSAFIDIIETEPKLEEDKNDNINTNNILDKDKNDNKLDDTQLNDIIINKISNFIVEESSKNANFAILSKEHNLMEMLTKFLSNIENLYKTSDTFLCDLVNKFTEEVKQIIIFEKVGVEQETVQELVIFNLFNTASYEFVRILLLFKIEFCCLLANASKNIMTNSYVLKRKKSEEEEFAKSLTSELERFINLFEKTLSKKESNFIIKDIIIIINKVFTQSILKKQDMEQNEINVYGVDLLIKDFEYIVNQLGSKDKNFLRTFSESNDYFSNFIHRKNLEEKSNKEKKIKEKKFNK